MGRRALGMIFPIVVLLGLMAPLTSAQDPPFGLFMVDSSNSTGNATRNCLLRTASATCPDKDLHFYLYTGENAEGAEIDVSDPEWFAKSKFKADLPTVMLIHGYRAGDAIMPMVVLKDEYIRRGEHNVITVDWGEFVREPCYVQAVGNIRHVSKCVGNLLRYFEDSGVASENITCVGHSIGAHVCGAAAKNAPKTPNKIIGLDPARVLMELRPRDDRLDAKDAKIVQIIHTDTSFYGQQNLQGTVDFCVNNGQQPFCSKTRNPRLCSHWHSVCIMAESLDPSRAKFGTACRNSCPQSLFFATGREGDPATIGERTAETASGMYCISTEHAPFCPDSYQQKEGEKPYGDQRCCPVASTRNRPLFQPLSLPALQPLSALQSVPAMPVLPSLQAFPALQQIGQRQQQQVVRQ